MSSKINFDKHRSRLLSEAMLKSAICGACVGFGAGFVAGALAWITKGVDFWLSFVAFFLIGALSSVGFFFVKFRLSNKSTARRLDSLGLEERLVTMVEYQNDDSVIAERQRKDAMASLEKVDPKSIEFKIPVKMIVTLSVIALFGLSMMTVSTLGDLGFLPSALEIGESIMNSDDFEEYKAITYLVEEGGYIEGVADQLVLKGTDASPVIAVAEDGYEFLYWDDGSEDPARHDKQVTDELVLTAVFALIEGDGEEDEDDIGVDGGGADPYGNPGGNQSLEGVPGKPNESLQGGGQYEEFNQIIDGDTYYRMDIELYKQKVKEYLEEHGDELTEQQRAMIEAYIGIV